MLNVYFGDMPDAIYNTALYFRNVYQDSWITDPLSREIILDVDKSTVVSANLIESPVLGPITPVMLSGGVKTLLLIKHDKKQVFNVSTCGDNCSRWILKLAEKRKVVINLHHVMDFGPDDFKIKVLNSGVVVHDMSGLIRESIPYL